MCKCLSCGEEIQEGRARLGYKVCMSCGEAGASNERKTWCVAPLHKSNYMLITNKDDLTGLNNKGGIVK